MHEFGIMDEVIAKLLQDQGDGPPQPGRVVRLRYGPGLTAASLRQAFIVQAASTPLAGARLELEPRKIEIQCPCGALLNPYHDPESHHDSGAEHDHGMPYLLCESCQAVHPIPHFNSVELVYAE